MSQPTKTQLNSALIKEKIRLYEDTLDWIKLQPPTVPYVIWSTCAPTRIKQLRQELLLC
jgi:hypothetical protein